MKRRPNGTGCVYARKRKDGTITYWLKFYRSDKQIYRNAGTSDRVEAEQKLAELVAGEAKGVPIATRQLTLGDAIANVKTANATDGKRTEQTYDALITPKRKDGRTRPHFDARTKMSAITTPKVREYIAARKKAGSSNATINRHLAALSRSFSLAIEDGLLHAKPHIPKLKESAARSGFFEREEFERLAAGLPPRLAHVARFAYITGWRLGETLGLEWRNVDFKAGEVRIHPGATKNGDGRVVKMTMGLRALLEDRKAARTKVAKKGGKLSLFVFTRKNGARIGSFRKWWTRACKAGHCEGRLFHDLRRTAVRNFVRAGIPERVAMAMSGHLTRSVFERYNIVSDGDLADAARKLDAAL